MNLAACPNPHPALACGGKSEPRIGPPAAATQSRSDTVLTPPELSAGPGSAGRPVNPLRPWRDWSAVIETLASRRGYFRLYEDRYRAVYQRLLAVLRANAGADPQQAEYFQRLEAVVRPWLSLKVLRQTEGPILEALLLECKQIEWEVCGGREPGWPWRWLTVALLLLTPAGVWTWFSYHGSHWLQAQTPESLRGLSPSALASLQNFGQFMEAHPIFWGTAFLPGDTALLLALLGRRRS
jgi:hypothetical protein